MILLLMTSQNKFETLQPDNLKGPCFGLFKSYPNFISRATIRDPQTGLLRTAEYRIQKTTWLTEDIAEDTEGVVGRFNKRISDITGLDLETAELLQMGNYGVGGQESFIDLYSIPFLNIRGFYIITPSQSECEDYRETFPV